MNNPVFQSVRFRDRDFVVKRDDLYSLNSEGSYLSGNKARKLYSFAKDELEGVEKIISYGSVQSNMLPSLAELSKLKGKSLEFYVDHIPETLKSKPRGNYAAALSMGAEVRVKSQVEGSLKDYALNQAETTSSLFVPEGGHSDQAETGIKMLASEISEWLEKQQIEDAYVMLPAGTGTTALYLQKHLSAEVLTSACVGSEQYLIQQFSELESDSSVFPNLLPTKKKYHFGKLYREFLEIWLQLKEQTAIEFDLLYDTLGWITLLDYLDANPTEKTIIYIHQGGLKGNETMKQRYQYRYGLEL